MLQVGLLDILQSVGRHVTNAHGVETLQILALYDFHSYVDMFTNVLKLISRDVQ